MRERLLISVTFDPARGYVAIGDGMPVVALSLSSLRRRLEDAHRGENIEPVSPPTRPRLHTNRK
jgi:hypothetical protein